MMFGDTLFARDWTVPSQAGTDLSLSFALWRQFGFGELRRGHLALWNPYLHSGTPFFGNFESALLYPPNWIYILLPLPKAINIEIAFHVFLAGLFTHLWARRRGLGHLAALLASALFMFGGPYFMHISAGHLSVLDTAAWIPMLFLITDELLQRPGVRWVLSGVAVVALQIFGGHPQTVFYSGIASAIYIAICLPQVENRLKVVLSCCSIYLGAALISAVQLLAGWQAGSESTRGGSGLSYEAASFLSFPSENFVTLFIPWFFGLSAVSPDAPHLIYWGRFYNWETTLFFGVCGLVLVVFSLMGGTDGWTRKGAMMIIALSILALGSNTPVFKTLYHWAPGFNRFRVTSRFMIEASLFLAMLAGMGFDHLIQSAKFRPRLVSSIFIAALLAIALSGMIHRSGKNGESGWWGQFISTRSHGDDSPVPSEVYHAKDFIQESAIFAARGIFICGLTCAILSALLFSLKFSGKGIYGITFLALAEVFVFAMFARSQFDLNPIVNPDPLIRLRRDDSGDFRVFHTGDHPNAPMSASLPSVGGTDPQISRRYDEYLRFAERLAPNEVFHLHALLRCKYVSRDEAEGYDIRQSAYDPLPRVQLVGKSRIMSDGKAILEAMGQSSFDPRREVILESTPVPEPEHGDIAGVVNLIETGMDHLVVEANTHQSSILLITDAYSNGWRALGLPGSAQKNYTILPADYILRGIPLMAGHHRIRIEFSPLAYRIGKWISLSSILLFAGLVGLELKSAANGRGLPRRNNSN